jgi:IclR family mhp operon transcriptional activator
VGHSYSATFHQVEFHRMPLKSDTVESASRTLLLLEELNRHRVTSIDRLHKATGLPKSTVVRLMKSLCAMGYAANDRRQGGYAVASRVKSLSNGFHGDPLVVEAARPWAIAFTRQYHWPIAIAVLDRSSVVVRFSTIPDSPVSPFHGTLNTHLSLLGRALGRAYLAFCPTSERSMLLDMLTRSQESEDKLATERKRALALLVGHDRSSDHRQPARARYRRHDLFHVGARPRGHRPALCAACENAGRQYCRKRLITAAIEATPGRTRRALGLDGPEQFRNPVAFFWGLISVSAFAHGQDR